MWSKSSWCRASAWKAGGVGQSLTVRAWIGWGRHRGGMEPCPWSCQKSLFHHEKVSPQISCQPEQKVGLVLLSGEVKTGQWEMGDRAGRVRDQYYLLHILWRTQNMKKDTIHCAALKAEFSMPYFILLHVLFSSSQSEPYICICVFCFCLLFEKCRYTWK